MKLWYADIRTLEHWDGLERAKERLPFKRLEKTAAYKQKADALRGIGAGLLLEYGLAAYGLAGREVCFTYGADGKPILAEYPHICFNLTHSGNYAAAVFADTDSGIDIEGIKTGKGKAARRFFSKEEREVLEKNWSDSLFTRIWTRKESYVKAVGSGIRLPFDSFSVLGEAVAGAGGAGNYFIRSYDCIPGYWLSICTKGSIPDGRPEKVDLREIFG